LSGSERAIGPISPVDGRLLLLSAGEPVGWLTQRRSVLRVRMDTLGCRQS
jgi:hypothetical protein